MLAPPLSLTVARFQISATNRCVYRGALKEHGYLMPILIEKGPEYEI